MLKLNKKRFFLFFGLLAAVISLTTLSLASGASIKDSKENIYVGEEEIIESNFIQTGGTVGFNGQAQKDVIIAGGTINIAGPVKGDVLAAGGTVRINGDVAGNIRVSGGTVEINGKVGKNVNAFGGTVIIGDDAEIGWDLLIFAGSIEIRGKVIGDIKGGGGNVVLANEVGGNVDLKIDAKDGHLVLYPKADIKGNLTYTASTEAGVKEGAKIAGETTYKPVALPIAPVKKTLGISSFVGKIMPLLGLLMMGLIIILLAPKTSRTVGQRMTEKPWASLGWGVVYLIVTPVVLILLAITVVGIPLSLITLVVYLIFLYLTKIFIGMVLGQKLLQWAIKKKEVPLVWAMILGVVIFYILTGLPFVGWIISLLGACWALGAMVEIKKQTLKQIEG
ncbi:MAG: polymer-forming cytoskeletal protein [Parcubacteria group bacterium]